MQRFCLILILIWSTAWAQTKESDVQEFVLKNGMKILVLEDHSIPNANMYLFWRVGSRNEAPGNTGLSHFFEHMMFNGAKKYGPKQFDIVMEANGGSNNAYTSQDVTVYTDWFPASSLETMFDLEADRIGHLAIDEKMLESERGVVLSERSTGLENSNYNKLSVQVQATAYFAHPYKWPVIGYESDIRAWTKKDLEDYFRTYYAPNNCVAVIVGDVKTAEVKALAEKYFEPIPAQDPPKKIRTIEPPQEGEKRAIVYKDISSPNVHIVYHVPEATHKDFYALEMLSGIISSGNSSRLLKSLIFEKQIATAVWAWNPSSLDPSLFEIFATASRGVTPQQLEEGILEEIAKVIKDGVTAKELEKVKNQKLMAFYSEIETINGKANNLGTYEVFFGDYRKLFSAPKAYESVTAADIQRVAKQYFTASNRTIGYLIANPEDKK